MGRIFDICPSFVLRDFEFGIKFKMRPSKMFNPIYVKFDMCVEVDDLIQGQGNVAM